MIGVYWRPQRISRAAVALVALVGVVGTLLVERFPVEQRARDYEEKVRAARLAASAMATLRDERVKLGYPIDLEVDPRGTGMIGTLSSPITSTAGNLPSKQLSTNPNFAALIVQLLREAGVRDGDRVGVGLSGSFPALNTSTFAALSVLGADPVVVSSAAASEWGANLVNFGWLDMEAVLREKGHFPYRSVAASLGGLEDRGVGMSRVGRSMLRSMIERHELPVIEGETIAESIEARMQVYDTASGARPIRVYVNVGGGTASLGGRSGRAVYRAGLNADPVAGVDEADSVMTRFILRGVPVIHINLVRDLADAYGLGPDEEGALRPIGEGPLFVSVEYNRWLALAVLLLVVLLLVAITRGEVSASLLPGGGKAEDRPQPMV